MRVVHATLLLVLAFVVAPVLASSLRVQDMVQRDEFEIARLSPDGEYLALSVPLGDSTALVVVDLRTMQRIGSANHGKNVHVLGFEWVASDRVVYWVGERFGELRAPQSTGELFAMNADGKKKELLIGFRAGNDINRASNIKQRKPEMVYAALLDPMPSEPKFALVSVYKLDGSEAGHSRVERLNVLTGRRTTTALAPVPRATYLVDHSHEVRFASGSAIDNVDKLYYRDGKDAPWRLVNDEAVSGRTMQAIAFAADNGKAYVLATEASGPDRLYLFDPADSSFTRVLGEQSSDVAEVLLDPATRAPFGVHFVGSTGEAFLLNPDNETSRLYEALQNSFSGQRVYLGARSSADTGLIVTASDRLAGDIFLFDYKAKKAQFVLARSPWADPDAMRPMMPITFAARDGLTIPGMLTLPAGEGKALPLVLYPHGGPIGIYDDWVFDPVVQWLASNGYAVLQVNYRGSGGYGRAFEQAGFREWGGKMQDDLTDATQWAIGQGIADPSRICIYGASYGGYAALMGAAKEPGLYRCAAGHVGVYDLRMIQSNPDAGVSVRTHFKAVLGEENLDAVSPALLAERIQVPVLLTAGREDVTAPARHTERMRDALIKAGKEVDAKIYPGEGHTFFVEANQIDSYSRLLAFLDRHIGANRQAKAEPTIAQ